MRNTKHLMFDSSGLRNVQSSTIPEYYNTFDQTILLDLESIVLKLEGQNFVDLSLLDYDKNILKQIKNLGLKMSFVKMESLETEAKLKLIESRMPEILSFIACFAQRAGSSSFKESIIELKLNNPLKYDLSQGHPFYEYKLKKLLLSLCLIDWSKGTNNYINGISFINEDGELICCHVNDERSFQEFLIENTLIVTKSAINRVYEENGELFIKLNLQIRFK
ncbi:HpaII family restriction endonuclease [Pedobacter fastidiosus]|uniref:HpaII family restriction endonuclease n=1 Tax=Pedobacter fastidiosus TaxID=2765361 RepID=A0ABR7KUE7_9SPHI|nr:HpaII family restriction endonuclease [Pedobacter fastidiosus]MBC6111731.1 HpaII family restriction endonuclease [Pedobacter fastidiosus]